MTHFTVYSPSTSTPQSRDIMYCGRCKGSAEYYAANAYDSAGNRKEMAIIFPDGHEEIRSN